MSRNYWTVYNKTTGSWVADGSVPRPNADLDIIIQSTQTDNSLVDGSLAFITPSTKYLYDTITFVWLEDDGTYKSKIETYIKNGTAIKIVDHNAVEYVGKFISLKPTWFVGKNGDYYDLEAGFRIMPSLA